MDETSNRPERARPFNWGRAGIVVIGLIALVAIGSWVVRAYPNPGYQAGYEATAAKGPEWIRAAVEAADGSARTVCDEIHHDFEHSPLEPRYDYSTFIKGCVDAVDHLKGRQVPVEKQ